MKTAISTDEAPVATGPFSQAIRHGNLVFTSGQIALTPEGKLLSGNIKEQTHQMMHNLQAVLQAAKLEFADVVQTTIYVTDMADYAAINEIYGSYLSAPYPARATVCVASLPLAAQVEISMIAAIS